MLAYLDYAAFAILKVRKRGSPRQERKLAGAPNPILSIVICLSFMTSTLWDTWLAFGMSLLFGNFDLLTWLPSFEIEVKEK